VNTASLAFSSQAQDGRWVVPSTGQIFHDAVPGSVRVSQWVAEHGVTLPLHPTQLYESLGQLCLFLVMLFLRRYRRFHGQIFGMWLMAYATLRTTVELFRGDLERGTLHGLLGSMGLSGLASKVPAEAWYNISTSEFISLCMFLGGATLLYIRAKQRFSQSPSPVHPARAVA
jgi:phosphatidylglycerol:prolipoprotein diacylglycerol transferase